MTAAPTARRRPATLRWLLAALLCLPVAAVVLLALATFDRMLSRKEQSAVDLARKCFVPVIAGLSAA